MRISDWSSDVCSSDLGLLLRSEYEPLTSGGSDRPSDHCRRETMPRSIGEPIRGALQSLLGFDHSATGKALLTPTILPERDHLGHPLYGRHHCIELVLPIAMPMHEQDRKSTRLNSSH